MKASNKIFTIPNIVSFIRMLIVIFAVIELVKHNYINSFLLYLTAVLTDFIDGMLARKLNQISELGKILDPVADKLMIGSALIILFIQGNTPFWYVAVIVSSILINVIGGLIVMKKITIVPPSIMIGKVAAVFSMITFELNIVFSYYIEYYSTYLLYLYIISTALLIISTIAYARIALKSINKIHKNNK
jgi:CDP-diacylglycerol--glycerol-3-phosphate 3-phosphatidyltransferase